MAAVTEDLVVGDIGDEAAETEGTETVVNPNPLEPTTGECLDDPNFAIICSFLEKFGELVRLGEVPFDELQIMLENTVEVPDALVKLHVSLLRRVFKSITPDKWEKSLAKFGHTYCNQDGWEIERFGYKKAKLQTKLRILKNLLEAQFDFNVKFKSEVNKLQAGDLRLIPLGRDCEGQVYWYQVDNDANLRVYREDIDDETWEIVASTREEFCELITKLQKGDVKKPAEAIIIDEDSNEKEIEAKEILLDTGKVEEEEEEEEDDDESEDTDEESEEEDIIPSKKNLPPKLISTTKKTTSESVKVIPTLVMEVDDQSEDMEIDETPPNLPEPVALQIENSKKLIMDSDEILQPVNLELPKVNLNSKTKFDATEEDQKEARTSELLVTEEILVKNDVKVLKSEQKPYQNSEKAMVGKPPLPSVSEPLKITEVNVTHMKVDTLSILEKIESDIVTHDKRSLVNEPPQKFNTIEDNMQSTNEIKTETNDIEETIIKSKTWVCGSDDKPRSPKNLTMQDEEKHLKVSKAEYEDSNDSPNGLNLTIKPVIEDSVQSRIIDESEVSKERSSEPAIEVQYSSASHLESQIRESKPTEENSLSFQAEIGGSKGKIEIEALIEKVQPEVCQKSAILKAIKPGIEGDVESNSKIQLKSISEPELLLTKSATSRRNDVELETKLELNEETKTEIKLDSKLETKLELNEETKTEIKLDSKLEKKLELNEETKTEIKLDSRPEEHIKVQVKEIRHVEAIQETKVEEMKEPKAETVEMSRVDLVEDVKVIQTPEVEALELPESNVMEIIEPIKESKSETIEMSKAKPEKVEIPVSNKIESTEEIIEKSKVNASEMPAVELAENLKIKETFDPQIEAFDMSVSKELAKAEETIQEPNNPQILEPPTVEKVEILKTDVAVNLRVEKDEVSNSEPIDLVKETIQELPPTETIQIAKRKAIEQDIAQKLVVSESKMNSLAQDSDVSVDLMVQTVPGRSPEPAAHLQQVGVTSLEKETVPISLESSATQDPKEPQLREKLTGLEKNGIILSEDTPKSAISSENNDSLPLLQSVNLNSCEDELIQTADKNQPINSGSNECNNDKILPDNSDNAVSPVSHAVCEIDVQKQAKLCPVDKSPPKPSLLGLVAYDSSSDDEEEESTEVSKKEVQLKENLKTSESKGDTESLLTGSTLDSGVKRKSDELDETPSKMPKLKLDKPDVPIFNPIVGDAVEEEMMMITGEGSGAQNDGGNDEFDVESNHKENISNGNEKNVDAEKSSSLKEPEEIDPTSANEDSQESLEVKVTPKRGRPSNKKKPVGKPPSSGERKPRSTLGAPKGRREVARLGVPLDSLEVNGSGDTSNERPVRASRRIAQIRHKEEEERRQLEEERLAQLKAAQLRKKQKQEESGKATIGEDGKVVKLKGSKTSKVKHVDYMPSPSASDSNSAEDEGEDYEEEAVSKPKKKKRKKRSKNGRHKTGNPWATSSEEEDSEAVEEEEEYHYEEEEQLVFNESDHEFSPESDLGEDGDAGPSRHARTAKRGEVDKEEETGCRKCGKGDHPEWILLCDKCDQGWHASCLRPQLWVIPEGEWFCPPCQHNLLVTKMNENLIEFDKLFKRRENDILRKQRLAYVGISLNNVLPTPEKEELIKEKSSEERRRREKKSRRRIILSDEEISDNFLDDRSGGESGRTSDEDSEGGPIYRLRTRRGAKTFDYKAYDDMINSAIRASDEEIEEIEQIAEEVEEPEADDAEAAVNGDEENVPVEVEHSGKNEAFEKHLQDQEDETDEELLGEKERLKRREQKQAALKKKKRSFRDLDDYTDEDNSDEDFKGSDAQEDDENDEDAVEEDESEWSGDKDDSDDSIAAKSRSRGKKGKYGRREEYLDVGTVRRSTRRRKARVSYDESDEEEEEEGEDKWNSEESDAEETPSESDDETYGKRKKKKTPTRSAVPRFFLGTIGNKSPAKKASSTKKKKRKVDEDDVDRAWSSSQGSKAKKKAAEETVERRTRGRKINFKDILDSGESDDDGNIRPKRRRISSDDDEEASTSRRLAEEIRTANQREAAMYAAQQKQGSHTSKKSDSVPLSIPSSVESENESTVKVDLKSVPPTLSQNPQTVFSSQQINLEMSNSDKNPTLELEMALSKPVPAPPIPASLAKVLGRTSLNNKSSRTPAGPGEKSPQKSHPNQTSDPQIPVTSVSSNSGPVTSSENLSSSGGSPNSDIESVSATRSISTKSLAAAGVKPISTAPLTSGVPPLPTSSKKGSASPSVSVGSPPTKASLTPPIQLSSPMRPIASHLQQSPHGVLSQGLPIDIGRVPNPTLYQGNPAIRPYHPMWVRNPGPPPYGPGVVPPPSIGKPPPLNSAAFMSQHGPPRPGYPSPPPLRIPNPNTSPLQAFQHFKRDSPHGPAMYRLPPGQPGGLPGLLAGGLVPHQGPPERFFGGPSPYPPYNILPPHTQSQPPQSLFSASQYDFRPGEPFKEDRRGAPGTPPGPSSPPTTQPSSTGASKEESSQQDSEFGGLVSYFSSQRSEEDMDT